MEAIRKVYERLPKTIRTPDALNRRRVEVILLPLDKPAKAGRPARAKGNSIEAFIGAWHGDPLVRPDQSEQ